MKSIIVCCLLLFSLQWASADEGHHHEVTAQQLGSVSFPTSCAPAVQKQFEKGVAWLHSFEYEQANAEFAEVAKADPSCAMAYWGQAMSLFHQLWDRPTAENMKKGKELLEEALKQNPKTQRERDYIEALRKFYANDDAAQYKARQKEYSDALDQIRKNNSGDREAAVFYALSLLGQQDSDDPQLTLQRKAVGILNEQLKGAPNHPGITHYIIHATDNPQLASMGLEAARAYAKIAPASVHATHMPSHIFTRLGLWQDSINSNLAALKVADQMGHFNMAHHKIHSMDFLEYAYLQIGDDVNAKAQVDAILKVSRDTLDKDYADFLPMLQANFQTTYALERRQWKEALAIKTDQNAPPLAQAVTLWAHAIAAGHMNDPAAAQQAMNDLNAAYEATKKSDKPYLAEHFDTPLDEARAWMLHSQGKNDEAVALLRKVSDKQDQVGKGETEMPAREMLADLLLQIGRAEDSLREYETALKTDPNRFNGLYGAVQAAQAAKQDQKASQYFAQLQKNCEHSNSDRPELKALAAVAEKVQSK